MTLPVALAGSAIAAAAAGTTLSVGALAGLFAVFGIAVRQVIMLVSVYRDQRLEGHDFGLELTLRGLRGRAAPILMTAIITALAAIPFAVLGSRPGLEILGPMALVILGGLVTSTLYALYVVPALYARLGSGAVHEMVGEEAAPAVRQLAS